MIGKAKQIFAVALCLLGALMFSGKSLAHALEQSYIFLSVNENTLDARFEITIADLNYALGTELPTDQSVTPEQLTAHLPAIEAYLNAKVSFSEPVQWQVSEFNLVSIPMAQYLTIPISFTPTEELPPVLEVRYEVLFDVLPQHRGFLVIENDWRTGTFNDEANIALIFTPSETSKTLDMMSASVFDGFNQMLKLGMHHIWIGIDHILFLLALLLPAVMYRTDKGWQSKPEFYPAFIHVVKVVTVFTVAHSITLSAATFELVTLSSRIVESIIAISIAVAAFDILRPIFGRRIWTIVFVFGLFHGMGFASVLAELGIPPGYMALSLLAFNVGVELGQVAIIAVVFPIIFACRSSNFYRNYTLRYGAVGMIVVSLYWFIERGFMIDLPAGQVAKWLLSNVGVSI